MANVCAHSRYKDRLLGLICKLDLEKAYDIVDWKFLQYMLSRMGFGEKMEKVDSGVRIFSLDFYYD